MRPVFSPFLSGFPCAEEKSDLQSAWNLFRK